MRKLVLGIFALCIALSLLSCGTNNETEQIEESFLSIQSSNGILVSIDDELYKDSLKSYTILREFPFTCYKASYLSKDNLLKYTNALGEYREHEDSLFIYSFMVKNTTEQKDITLSLAYNTMLDYFDEVARVLTYTNDTIYIYQKKDDYVRLGITDYEYPLHIGTTAYTDENYIFNEKITIDKDETIKYSILIWIDDTDPDMKYYSSSLYTTAASFILSIK